ncbi:Glycoside hydrolase 2 (Mannanase, beta-galactosidase) [Dimargaris xerosporica]|nr:Glycoside hydrolase 2 (Mannanase, beta-galactosidase) [Dimargaris xerosporica]
MEKQTNKPYRPSRTLDRDEKKKKKAEAGYNPKSFSFFSKGKTARAAQRNLDNDQKRLHLPLNDRSPEVAPPVIVAVVGPPKTGKTTLIRSLVRHYTKQPVRDIKGPITVVSGKTRRLTFFESKNDLNSMIDIGKVADLILLMIDAKYGFEMETFEFLNILQTHGFPRIMGVLTHLDKIRNPRSQKKARKALKHRFWTEIYNGAKLFNLTRIRNGRYLDREILNMARFISVKKFRPLAWRNTHSYLLADRMEDLTPPDVVHEKPKVDRTVTLYGYLRGTPLKAQSRVHIPGVGDLTVEEIDMLQDPCPLPDKVRKSLSDKHKLLYAPMSDVGGVMYDKDAVYINVPGLTTRAEQAVDEASGQGAGDGQGSDSSSDSNSESEWIDSMSKRQLRRRQRELKKRNAVKPGADQIESRGEHMVLELQDSTNTFADLIDDSQMRIFSGSTPVVAKDYRAPDASDSSSGSDTAAEDDASDGSASDSGDGTSDSDGEYGGRFRRRAMASVAGESSSGAGVPAESLVFADTDDELGSSDDDGDGGNADDAELLSGALRWKEGMVDRAQAAFRNTRRRLNLMDLVYRPDLAGGSDQLHQINQNSDDDDDDLLRPRLTHEAKAQEDAVLDACKAPVSAETLVEWDDEDTLESIRNRFITGSLDHAANGGHTPFTTAVSEAAKGNDQGLEDGFVDLEAMTGNSGRTAGPDGSDHDEDAESADELGRTQADLDRKREELKKKFDAEYDGRFDKSESDAEDADEEERLGLYKSAKEEMHRQQRINQEEFADDDEELRAQIEGYRPGKYVRLLLRDVPYEFVANFDPTYPVVVGGLLANEQKLGFLQVRVKRHRWYRRILKTNDPLIFSLGWRRFQSLPVFSIEDGVRNRMLKYTPEHMHCLATFFGPVTAPGTGFCCFQSVASDSNRDPGFRVSATGVVLDVDQSTQIVKKLKLTGVPDTIQKNSCIIRDMFQSPLEVVKFHGAGIRTVSGIRGRVGKPIREKQGQFRAHFEAPISRSDIVFLRAWYGVNLKRYYNPVTSLLLDDQHKSWQGMKLVRELRRERGLPIPQKEDSTYMTHEEQLEQRRVERQLGRLHVPAKLRAQLPFDSRPRITVSNDPMENRATIMQPDEARMAKFFNAVQAVHDFEEKQHAKVSSKFADRDRKKALEAREKYVDKKKRKLQEFYKRASLREKKKARTTQL